LARGEIVDKRQIGGHLFGERNGRQFSAAERRFCLRRGNEAGWISHLNPRCCRHLRCACQSFSGNGNFAIDLTRDGDFVIDLAKRFEMSDPGEADRR